MERFGNIYGGRIVGKKDGICWDGQIDFFNQRKESIYTYCWLEALHGCFCVKQRCCANQSFYFDPQEFSTHSASEVLASPSISAPSAVHSPDQLASQGFVFLPFYKQETKSPYCSARIYERGANPFIAKWFSVLDWPHFFKLFSGSSCPLHTEHPQMAFYTIQLASLRRARVMSAGNKQAGGKGQGNGTYWLIVYWRGAVT